MDRSDLNRLKAVYLQKKTNQQSTIKKSNLRNIEVITLCECVITKIYNNLANFENVLYLINPPFTYRQVSR